MSRDLSQLLEELENISDRAHAAGFALLSNTLDLTVRCARHHRRATCQRLLTIISTAIELCQGE